MKSNCIEKSFLITATLAGILLFGSLPLADAETTQEKGTALARQLEKANDGFVGEVNEMELVLINAHGDKVDRRMISKVKETNGDGDKSIVTFQWPADVKDTRMLTWTHKSRDDDQWLYLPSIKRVKRISSNNKSGSFMGSEFAYEDLNSIELEKYSWNFLKEDQVEGRKVWVLEMVPVDKRSGYSKQISYMDQEYMNPLKTEYYDRKGELLKTSTFSAYTQHGKLWRIGKIDVLNHQTGKRSVLTWKNRKTGVVQQDRDFEKDNLEG